MSGAARNNRNSDATGATATLNSASPPRDGGADRGSSVSSAGSGGRGGRGGGADKLGDLRRNCGAYGDWCTEDAHVRRAKNALPLFREHELDELHALLEVRRLPWHGDAVQHGRRQIFGERDEPEAVLPRDGLVIEDVVHLAC